MSKTQPQDLPDTFNWRDHGVVTEIKNQGIIMYSSIRCNFFLQVVLALVGLLGKNFNCHWLFAFLISTCANIEGQWALKGNRLMSFSVEQLVDCDGSQDTVKLVRLSTNL